MRQMLLAVSSAEDPEKLLDQVVTEMQEDLIKMRQASAQVKAGCFQHVVERSQKRRLMVMTFV